MQTARLARGDEQPRRLGRTTVQQPWLSAQDVPSFGNRRSLDLGDMIQGRRMWNGFAELLDCGACPGGGEHGSANRPKGRLDLPDLRYGCPRGSV